MTPSNLVKILDALKKGRLNLIDDYRTEKPDLYWFMFKYEPFSSDMDAAINRYMFHWLSQHPAIYQSMTMEGGKEDASLENGKLDAFILSYRKLCERFIVDGVSDSKAKSHVLEKMVHDSIMYLDKLLGVSELANMRLQKLVYQNIKSKTVFDRLFNELKEKQDGLS